MSTYEPHDPESVGADTDSLFPGAQAIEHTQAHPALESTEVEGGLLVFRGRDPLRPIDVSDVPMRAYSVRGPFDVTDRRVTRR